jgi:hypothetical protein
MESMMIDPETALALAKEAAGSLRGRLSIPRLMKAAYALWRALNLIQKMT